MYDGIRLGFINLGGRVLEHEQRRWCAWPLTTPLFAAEVAPEMEDQRRWPVFDKCSHARSCLVSLGGVVRRWGFWGLG